MCEKAIISLFSLKYMCNFFLALARATCTHWLRLEPYIFGEREGGKERNAFKIKQWSFSREWRRVGAYKMILEADQPKRWKNQNADTAKDNGVGP